MSIIVDRAGLTPCDITARSVPITRVFIITELIARRGSVLRFFPFRIATPNNLAVVTRGLSCIFIAFRGRPPYKRSFSIVLMLGRCSVFVLTTGPVLLGFLLVGRNKSPIAFCYRL